MKFNRSITVRELADWLELPYYGPGGLDIEGINEIHKVTPGDITFVDVEKYYNKALKSAASVVLINKQVDFPTGKAIIVCEDPFSEYNRIVKEFMHEETPAWFNSPKDRIANGRNVSVGEDVIIHPGVVIGNNVTIGNNCVLYPNVILYDNSHIGNNVIIHANSVIGSHAYYYKTRKDKYEKMISCGRVIIEDDVEIGAGCTIDKGVSGDTRIGKGSKLDNQVHLGHGVEVGERCLLGAQVGVGGKTIIEDEVIIWGQTGITKGIRIGAKAIISAQSGVSKSLEGGKHYFGTPAQEIRKAQKEMAWVRKGAQQDDLKKAVPEINPLATLESE